MNREEEIKRWQASIDDDLLEEAQRPLPRGSAALRWGGLAACLCAAVNHNGDSDSTGAIAGNILGAYLGDGALSQAWIAPLDTLKGIELMARELDAVAREQGL